MKTITLCNRAGIVGKPERKSGSLRYVSFVDTKDYLESALFCEASPAQRSFQGSNWLESATVNSEKRILMAVRSSSKEPTRNYWNIGSTTINQLHLRGKSTS